MGAARRMKQMLYEWTLFLFLSQPTTRLTATRGPQRTTIPLSSPSLVALSLAMVGMVVEGVKGPAASGDGQTRSRLTLGTQSWEPRTAENIENRTKNTKTEFFGS